MARMPRLVIPGYPHHVTQRGNRRMRTFFSVDDYQYYLKLMARTKAEAGAEIWAYCLMPNHIHAVVVPQYADSLAKLFQHVHRKYSRYINIRQEWRGHLWQERFHSFVMDESHLLRAVRYVERLEVLTGRYLKKKKPGPKQEVK
jgi:putative transposase